MVHLRAPPMGVYLPREQDFGWFAEQLWDEIREEWSSNLVFDSLASSVAGLLGGSFDALRE